MDVVPGVELSEAGGRTVTGANFKLDRRLSLKDYAKLNDPKLQQAQHMQTANQPKASTGEDPYRDFKKFAYSQALKEQNHRDKPKTQSGGAQNLNEILKSVN